MDEVAGSPWATAETTGRGPAVAVPMPKLQPRPARGNGNDYWPGVRVLYPYHPDRQDAVGLFHVGQPYGGPNIPVLIALSRTVAGKNRYCRQQHGDGRSHGAYHQTEGPRLVKHRSRMGSAQGAPPS